MADPPNSNRGTYALRKKGKKEKWVFVPQTYPAQLLYNSSGENEGIFYVDERCSWPSRQCLLRVNGPLSLVAGCSSHSYEGLYRSSSGSSAPLAVT